MEVEQLCTACNMKTDSMKYLKSRTVFKAATIKTKKNNNTLIQNEVFTSHEQPKTEMFLITKTMSTTLVFHHLKVTPILLSVPETMVKLITCSKCLKKKLTKDQTIY